ncbi:hypothetical protein [Sulfuricurvum sp.]|uniref:hypothetical protein n=1 Tax=Sulfuricurvum sp. TaxID=2025608 RepID=UPI003BB730DA
MKNTIIIALALLISHSINASADGIKIDLYKPTGLNYNQACTMEQITQSKQPPSITLSRDDFTTPISKNQRWNLSSDKWNSKKAFESLQDHCFILRTAENHSMAGVVLSSHTARFNQIPVIFVEHKGGNVTLHSDLFRAIDSKLDCK